MKLRGLGLLGCLGLVASVCLLTLPGCEDQPDKPRAPAHPFSGQTVTVAFPAGLGFGDSWRAALDEWSEQTGAKCKLAEYNRACGRPQGIAGGRRARPALCRSAGDRCRESAGSDSRGHAGRRNPRRLDRLLPRPARPRADDQRPADACADFRPGPVLLSAQRLADEGGTEAAADLGRLPDAARHVAKMGARTDGPRTLGARVPLDRVSGPGPARCDEAGELFGLLRYRHGRPR